MKVAELKDVSKIYHPKEESEVHALDHVSLEIEQGDFLVIRGVSGSGKSTLLNMLGLLDRPSSGQVYIDGTDVDKLREGKRASLRNERIGFVLQDFGLINYRNVIDNCMIPYYFSSKRIGNIRSRIMDTLQLVGMEKYSKRVVSKLSGGQKQRVAIARALINDPILLLADEPTGQLDSKTKSEICQLFQNLNQRGTTIVMVTHDEEMDHLASRVLHIKDGEIVEELRQE